MLRVSVRSWRGRRRENIEWCGLWYEIWVVVLNVVSRVVDMRRSYEAITLRLYLQNFHDARGEAVNEKLVSYECFHTTDNDLFIFQLFGLWNVKNLHNSLKNNCNLNFSWIGIHHENNKNSGKHNTIRTNVITLLRYWLHHWLSTLMHNGCHWNTFKYGIRD